MHHRGALAAAVLARLVDNDPAFERATRYAEAFNVGANIVLYRPVIRAAWSHTMRSRMEQRAHEQDLVELFRRAVADSFSPGGDGVGGDGGTWLWCSVVQLLNRALRISFNIIRVVPGVDVRLEGDLYFTTRPDFDFRWTKGGPSCAHGICKRHPLAAHALCKATN